MIVKKYKNNYVKLTVYKKPILILKKLNHEPHESHEKEKDFKQNFVFFVVLVVFLFLVGLK